MDKKEFLDTLGRRLSQQLSQEKVAEHIRYYDNYLTEKILRGMTEEEEVAQLGDPLLIARTIMDTAGEEMTSKTIYEEDASGNYQNSSEERFSGKKPSVHKMEIRYQAGCLVAVIVAVLILTLILKLVGSVLSLVLPILIPVLVIVLVIEYFKKR